MADEFKKVPGSGLLTAPNLFSGFPVSFEFCCDAHKGREVERAKFAPLSSFDFLLRVVGLGGMRRSLQASRGPPSL